MAVLNFEVTSWYKANVIIHDILLDIEVFCPEASSAGVDNYMDAQLIAENKPTIVEPREITQTPLRRDSFGSETTDPAIDGATQRTALEPPAP